MKVFSVFAVFIQLAALGSIVQAAIPSDILSQLTTRELVEELQVRVNHAQGSHSHTHTHSKANSTYRNDIPPVSTHKRRSYAAFLEFEARGGGGGDPTMADPTMAGAGGMGADATMGGGAQDPMAGGDPNAGAGHDHGHGHGHGHSTSHNGKKKGLMHKAKKLGKAAFSAFGGSSARS